MINRVIVMVLDSLGVGAMPDAEKFGDSGADTLGHIQQEYPTLELPNLCSLGLGRIADIRCSKQQLSGAYGRMAEKSPSKDTTSGHWEMAGLIVEKPFPTYPNGFPDEIIEEFEERTGRGTLGNYPRSGTTILEELGAEHLKTGRLIVYTSADSVFQVAAHVDMVPLEQLYEYCLTAREILSGEHAVGRVIARPFSGGAGEFERINAARKDYSIQPPGDTLLDVLKAAGRFTIGVGKIGAIFGHRGLSAEWPTRDNRHGMELTLKALASDEGRGRGLVFTNLVDFDMAFGHRRNVAGYAEALMEFDFWLPKLQAAMEPEDLLIITADHGCDPTFSRHTDHTREYVPLLVWGKQCMPGVNLGIRRSFADLGATAADFLDAPRLLSGISFKKELTHAG